MTKDELEKKVEEYLENNYCCKSVCTCDEIKECKEGTRIRCLAFNYRKHLIVDFAEPREKRIEELELKINHLTKHLEPQTMTALFEQVEEEVKQEQRIKELEAQIEKMKCCGNCKYYQFQNDARYYTCTKDGKRNGKNYRSCEFNLEKWERR